MSDADSVRSSRRRRRSRYSRRSKGATRGRLRTGDTPRRAHEYVHRHVARLERLGHVVSTDRVTSHTDCADSHARHARDSTLTGSCASARAPSRWRREAGERAQFVAPERTYGVCLYRASDDRVVDTALAIGSRTPLHATAAGEAILAASGSPTPTDSSERPNSRR